MQAHRHRLLSRRRSRVLLGRGGRLGTGQLPTHVEQPAPPGPPGRARRLASRRRARPAARDQAAAAVEKVGFRLRDAGVGEVIAQASWILMTGHTKAVNYSSETTVAFGSEVLRGTVIVSESSGNSTTCPLAAVARRDRLPRSRCHRFLRRRQPARNIVWVRTSAKRFRFAKTHFSVKVSVRSAGATSCCGLPNRTPWAYSSTPSRAKSSATFRRAE